MSVFSSKLIILVTKTSEMLKIHSELYIDVELNEWTNDYLRFFRWINDFLQAFYVCWSNEKVFFSKNWCEFTKSLFISALVHSANTFLSVYCTHLSLFAPPFFVRFSVHHAQLMHQSICIGLSMNLHSHLSNSQLVNSGLSIRCMQKVACNEYNSERCYKWFWNRIIIMITHIFVRGFNSAERSCWCCGCGGCWTFNGNNDFVYFVHVE